MVETMHIAGPEGMQVAPAVGAQLGRDAIALLEARTLAAGQAGRPWLARVTASRQVELFFDVDVTLPAPWEATASATVWVLSAAPGPARSGPAAEGASAAPVLVTLGYDPEGGLLMLNLAQIGSFQVTGPPEAVGDVLAEMSLELLVSVPDLRVVVTGASAGMLAEVIEAAGPDRARRFPVLGPAEFRGLVDDLAAAAAPLVVLDPERKVGATAHAALREHGVLVISARELATVANTLELLADEHAGGHELQQGRRLLPSGITVSAATAAPGDHEHHLVKLRAEARAATAPAGAAGGSSSASSARDVATSIDPHSDHAAAPDTPSPASPAAGHAGEGTYQFAELRCSAGDNAAAAAGEIPQSLEQPAEGDVRSIEHTTAHTLNDDTDHPPVYPAPEADSDHAATPEQAPAPTVAGYRLDFPADVHPLLRRGHPVVRLLGPTVDVIGATGRDPGTRQRVCTRIATYLCLYPGRSRKELIEAVWGSHKLTASKTVDPRISNLRSWLGPNPETGESYLPAGSTQLDKAIRTDWSVFTDLVGPDVHAADSILLEQALELVRGRPLESEPAADYGFAEQAAAEMVAQIAEAAGELAARHLRNTSWTSADHYAQFGIGLDPSNEALWRIRIHAAYAAGDKAATFKAISQMKVAIAQYRAHAEPETHELVDAIDRRDTQTIDRLREGTAR